MATLTIRNLSDQTRERLRVRAARHGRSMEAEVRAILTEVALEPDRAQANHGLQGWVDQLYGDAKPANVVDDLIAERRREASSE